MSLRATLALALALTACGVRAPPRPAASAGADAPTAPPPAAPSAATPAAPPCDTASGGACGR